jgi:hypothetical protein
VKPNFSAAQAPNRCPSPSDLRTAAPMRQASREQLAVQRRATVSAVDMAPDGRAATATPSAVTGLVAAAASGSAYNDGLDGPLSWEWAAAGLQELQLQLPAMRPLQLGPYEAAVSPRAKDFWTDAYDSDFEHFAMQQGWLSYAQLNEPIESVIAPAQGLPKLRIRLQTMRAPKARHLMPSRRPRLLPPNGA